MYLKNEMDIIEKYYMYNRVANSDGFADSINDLQNHFDIKVQEYTPGTRINYWEIPKRWNVYSAEIYDSHGNLIWDAARHPLALWAYSQPFNGKVTKKELIKHLFSNPLLPERIPFRFHMMFRHWEKDWGFSVPHNLLETLHDDTYEVSINTEFTDDPMQTFTYESTGTSEDVILIIGHWCHSGQANDGLSGSATGIKIIDEMRSQKHHYTYRFLGVPELIGSIAYLEYLKENRDNDKLKAVIGLNFLGHNDSILMFQSIGGRSRIDQYLQEALLSSGATFQKLGFKELVEIHPESEDETSIFMGGGTGDEAPFEAPGFSIPTSALSRKTPFPEYHTDADNPELLSSEKLKEIRNIILSAIQLLENDWMPETAFTNIPCLSHPDLDLFVRPFMESNIPRKETFSSSKINFHQISTYIVYDFNKGLSVFDLAQKYNIPFNVLNKYLENWIEKGLLLRKKFSTLEIDSRLIQK